MPLIFRVAYWSLKLTVEHKSSFSQIQETEWTLGKITATETEWLRFKEYILLDMKQAVGTDDSLLKLIKTS